MRLDVLQHFLRGMKSDWNIRLFHYRNYGSEYGRVLLGIQVPLEDDERFVEFLENTGYSYKAEDDNPAFGMFVEPM
jgi:threonine dehydratase